MKKQFNRMRQLANQHVGRAEKTEVLSDDLLLIEKRLDVVRVVSHNTQKRLVTCLQGQIGTDAEKRHKKLPLTALSQCMQEGGSLLGEESLIGKMMEACSDVESKLAMELSQHEVQIEKDVLEPLNQLAEVDIPNIQKQRKQLAKMVLDWDSARARWNQATKSIISGTNFQALTAKAESLKDEMVEAGNKVELCKDQLAADMYNFFSKEGDYARYYVMLLEEQAEYHRKALAVLETVLPTIQAQQDSWTEKPAFGTALEDHLKRSNREIALPIEACVMMLLETGMKEEGLFRIAAGQSKLKKLKAALDCSTSQLEEFYSDPHAVAGALKSYVRELPEPLMTFHLYDEWIQASNVSDPDKKLQALWVTCDKLPKPNKANLRYLIKFLAKLAQESAVNKMTPSNIAIVLGPNLLWAKNEGTLAEMAAATSVHVVTIIEPIIQHADWFFPEEIDFNVSGMFAPIPSNHTNHHGSEFDCGTLERKRPVSMAVLEGDLIRKDSLGGKLLDQTPRRGGTLNRKHTSPAFQPPLPPVEPGGVLPQPVAEQQLQAQPMGAGPEISQSSCAQGQLSNTAAEPPLIPVTEESSSSKPKDTASTPPPLRNGGNVAAAGQSQLHSAGTTANQLSAGHTQNTTGPSPHMIRRATKKPAPAPPKPGNHPPAQPGSQGPPSAANQLFTQSPKQSASQGTGHSPPSQPTNQGSVQPHFTAQPSVQPRRHSSNPLTFQAPSHPPPQPPTQATPPTQPKAFSQATGGSSESGPEQSPPRTPTPPDTPPLVTHGGTPPPAAAIQPSPTSGHDSPQLSSPFQSNTLPRPRPVPKPRHRPSVPPPPQPPVNENSNGNGNANTASKIITGWGSFHQ
ncbi:rho GTPase-activating protein 17-like isoform X2 [Acipenser ruthenus]|uniref:rho GTPase-activating protein 17-like isoform X2 n=1 Tax=Acipenser ruthenus TaxID=7906 RepID=UPI00155FA2EC|nr:rho GTPase-activating protein 17-like isoform X2 [Acipenser ruthenus]XP_033908294.2 rho GTPase-activating protein 17-like isoform X2 [Acipenser ruthenus]XP_033908295.2 rho GTPase-activating protein 17-like isoform X2 [Acipenser ruthenus]